ncbi:MAG: alpha/beta hydrolase, partial [Chloroflexota bacterium]
LNFPGADGTERSGTLRLPPGSGPFPCVVVLGGRMAGRVDVGAALATAGWATYSYDPRGVGASKGAFARGAVSSLAADAVAAAEALAKRPEIGGQRLVLLGIGEGGQAAALASAAGQNQGGEAYVGVILAASASVGPAFPALAELRIATGLAPFYGWDPAGLAAYRRASVERWQDWLFKGEDQVTLLRRRIAVRALRELADADPSAALAQAKGPVLIVHGAQDRWTPVAGAEDLAARLQGAGVPVTVQVFPDLGEDLGGSEGAGLFSPPVEQAIVAWLEQIKAP